MKKIFILLLLLIPAFCFSEQIDEMSILGINLNSTVQEAKKALDEKYPHAQSTRETNLISGSYKDSIVYRFKSYYPTYASKTVNNISIGVASYDNISMARLSLSFKDRLNSTEYSDIETALISKYGLIQTDENTYTSKDASIIVSFFPSFISFSNSLVSRKDIDYDLEFKAKQEQKKLESIYSDM